MESMGSMSGVFYFLPLEVASLAEPGAYQFSWAGKRTHSGTTCVCPPQHRHCRHASPAHSFYMGPGDLDLVLMLA